MIETATQQPVDGGVREANRLMETLAERLGAQARAAILCGESVERDDVTVIPVARAVWGFGGGGGTGGDRGAGSGGGGGMLLSPVGYIEISHGRTRYRPIFGQGLIAVVALVALAAARRFSGPCKQF